MDDGIGDGRSSPRRSWEVLGTGSQLVLEGVELWWVELPFVAPVVTAAGTHRSRPLLMVRLICRHPTDLSVVEGWGECAALADTAYDAEDVAGAWDTLEHMLLPALWELAGAQGRPLPSVQAVQGLAADAPARPLAFAALEMAVGDAHLRASGRSFAALLGVTNMTVEPGAVTGVPNSTNALVAAVASLVGNGYVRVKVKVAPGTEMATMHALTDWAATAVGPVPRFQVDANGAYGPDDIELLAGLDQFGLLCIEQPFDRGDLESHRRLATRMTTPICLDESLDGPVAVADAVTTGACSVVCVKPARLGGIASALEVIEWCTTHDVAWWIGGMFESGFARRINTALAALPGRTLPGDLAVPATYLAGDLVDRPVVRRDEVSGRLGIDVSDVPGMGPAPDLDRLEASMERRITVTAASI